MVKELGIDMAKNFDDLVYKLSKSQLRKFLVVYDNYLVEFYQEHSYPDEPVGMLEFFNNDYMQMLEDEEDEDTFISERIDSLSIPDQISELYYAVLDSDNDDAIEELDTIIYENVTKEFGEANLSTRCRMIEDSGVSLKTTRNKLKALCEKYNVTMDLKERDDKLMEENK